MSWSRFPNFISKELLHCLKSNSINRSENASKSGVKDINVTENVFLLPYAITNGW